MTLTESLQSALENGFRQIGQLSIHPIDEGYLLCHLDDSGKVGSGDHSDLVRHTDPADAIEIGLYDESGRYRFTKGEISLKSGWVFELFDVAGLRQTLDHFYPASLGLWKAWKGGELHVQNLRDKLDRQTGMYRHSGKVSDAGAQEVIRETCGPSKRCSKRILWQIDEETPLEESEASRFDGILNGKSEPEAIPLVCQEACNHFVAQCRGKAKEEFEKG